MNAAEALRPALQALAPRLREGATHVDTLLRLSGGASQESWSFDVHAAGQPPLPLVLRRAPEGAALRHSGNPALADEAQLIALAAAAGVPVPQVVCVLSAEMGLGEGYVMRHVAGETLGRRIVTDPALEAARAVLARRCGVALARIHAIEAGRLPPLRRAPARSELAHYAARHAEYGQHKPVFALALRWLADHAPDDPPRLSLVHGDFRNGNLIVGAEGLRAVLDWELAHLGDPMEDLGWLCGTSWRFGRDELPVGGFGLREDLFAGYVDAGGTLDADRVHYWQVFGTLRWGIMCESMAAAYLSGAERNVERAAIGRRSSETEIDLLNLLLPRSHAA